MIQNPAWVASAKLAPIAAEIVPPETAPITATPSVIPTWRLVEAIAAATPACAGGIPDTAVLVIGGFTSPDPRPSEGSGLMRPVPKRRKTDFRL